MRAWQIAEHGDPAEVLRLVDIAPPRPGPGEVAVSVRCAGLNFADILLCRGTYQVRPPLPFVPGLELVGTVRELGPATAGFEIGQRVLASPTLPHGALAEVALAGAQDLFPVPDVVDDASAAALQITYQSAWLGLFRRGGLAPGETVLIHAGASGVGSAAIHLARAGGAGQIIATAGGQAKVDLCRELGADVAIDYREVDLIDAVRGATGGRGVDVVFDPVGGAVGEASRRLVAFEGRLVVIGFAAGTPPTYPANHVLVKNYGIVGLNIGSYRTAAPEVLVQAHTEIMEWFAQGLVRPQLMPELPFDQVPAALAAMADRGAVGKMVVRVDGSAPPSPTP